MQGLPQGNSPLPGWKHGTAHVARQTSHGPCCSSAFCMWSLPFPSSSVRIVLGILFGKLLACPTVLSFVWWLTVCTANSSASCISRPRPSLASLTRSLLPGSREFGLASAIAPVVCRMCSLQVRLVAAVRQPCPRGSTHGLSHITICPHGVIPIASAQLHLHSSSGPSIAGSVAAACHGAGSVAPTSSPASDLGAAAVGPGHRRIVAALFLHFAQNPA